MSFHSAIIIFMLVKIDGLIFLGYQIFLMQPKKFVLSH